MPIQDGERHSANNSALNCFGTGYLFEKRIVPLRFAIKSLSFLSLAGPLSIGALVLAVGTTGSIIFFALAAASTLSSVQVIVSLWALVANWQNNLSYYIESKSDNYRLADKFNGLANNVNLSDSKWRHQKDVLETMSEMRKDLDLRFDISDEEKRMGMRAALRRYQRPCVACSQVPVSLDSHNCDVCGNFKRRRIRWLM
ncbi:MAG: hypothetical protein JJT88_20850 [Gammaproteobacteria bacterium]|nr:hypothetical protein [Gammaproteobacteria bacterium]